MTPEAPPAWDERIAELLTAGNQLRDLAADMLAAFRTSEHGGVAVVLPPTLAAWRKRLEDAS